MSRFKLTIVLSSQGGYFWSKIVRFRLIASSCSSFKGCLRLPTIAINLRFQLVQVERGCGVSEVIFRRGVRCFTSYRFWVLRSALAIDRISALSDISLKVIFDRYAARPKIAKPVAGKTSRRTTYYQFIDQIVLLFCLICTISPW
jgi:hypothetical protein